MARGDSKNFVQYDRRSYLGEHNNSTDTFRRVFVTETFAATDANGAAASLSDFTQVASSGNYIANADLNNVTWLTSGNVSTLNYDDFSIAADAANPTTATCMIIYNSTSANNTVLKIIDLTTDGTTAVDMTQGYTHQVNAAGSATVTTNP